VQFCIASRAVSVDTIVLMTFEGSVLFRYYQRIPSTGSSSSSGMTTPSLTADPNASTSQSVAACSQSNHTSSQSGGMSVCNKPRKWKVSDPNRRRSNPAVILLNPDDLVAPSVVPIIDQPAESIVEVIALSSDGSTTSVAVEVVVLPCNRKGKSNFPLAMRLMIVVTKSLCQLLDCLGLSYIEVAMVFMSQLNVWFVQPLLVGLKSWAQSGIP
jgi:hypothetical protein